MEFEPLYRRVLGRRFMDLGPEVRALHDVQTYCRATGTCDVRRGSGWLVRLAAWFAGLPPSGTAVPLVFEIAADARREFWTRDFQGRKFVSVLSGRGDSLFERVGPVTFEFKLVVRDGTLSMELVCARLLGVLRIPQFAQPFVRTVESGSGGRYHFEVAVQLPILGLLIEYRGTLTPPPQ